MSSAPDHPDLEKEQDILDAWSEWADVELSHRRGMADRAYKRAVAAKDEAAWQHAEIVERSYGQLSDMIAHQDPYFARIRGRMRDIDGEVFDVDLRIHRYHRSESFVVGNHQEMLDISHLAPLADLVRNPELKELTVSLNERELMQWSKSHPHIIVDESRVEDIELENGRVVRMAPRYGAIFEDRIRRRLQQSALPALDVLADVLDPKQNAIVGNRSPDLKLLVLDGPAGTGKTVVAAHRIAVAEAPDSAGIYLTPTAILRDYIKPVLPRLGVEQRRAHALSLSELATVMWPDLDWSGDLNVMLNDSPWSTQEWAEAFAQARSSTTNWTQLFRAAARRLGHKASDPFGSEDVVPLLWMGAWTGRPAPRPQPKWVIVDEAQAVPSLAYHALREWLGAQVSWIVAGDLMQQGNQDWDNWSQIQAALGMGKTESRVLWLSRSYRVPPKIHAAAERLRLAVYPNAQSSESVPWHPHSGEVSVMSIHSQADQVQAVLKLVDQCRQSNIIAVAILAPDPAHLGPWEASVRDAGLDCQVLNGTIPYRGGLTLTVLDFVRGLEFDAVILVDCDQEAYPPTLQSARKLYTSLTRARRQAYFLTAGLPSPWLSIMKGDGV